MRPKRLGMDLLDEAKAHRDSAWQMLRDIRAVIGAGEQESTLDEVTRLMEKLDAARLCASTLAAIEIGTDIALWYREQCQPALIAARATGLLPAPKQYDLYKVYLIDDRRSKFFVAPGEDPDLQMRRHLAAHNITPADVRRCDLAGYQTLDVRPKNSSFTTQAI